MSISSTIKSIQDIMRKDVGVDGDAQRIGQLVWMFFLKIYDDKETEYELLDDNYKSPIPAPLRWRNWAANPEGMTGCNRKCGSNSVSSGQFIPILMPSAIGSGDAQIEHDLSVFRRPPSTG